MTIYGATGCGSGRQKMKRWFANLSACLPTGGSLPEAVWASRHRFLVILTWLHALLISLSGLVFQSRWELSLDGLFESDSVLHPFAECAIVVVCAALAGWHGLGRSARATCVGFGLMSCSAIMVHLSGGYIEFHFHFFVMIVFLALYQDWIPFGLAIAFVALHHGVVGILWPEDVYNHAAAIASPWTWAGIHAFFVLSAAVGSVIAWRFNETAYAWTRQILDATGEGIFGLNTQGRLTFVNPAACRMLGLTESHAIGKQVFEILPYVGAQKTVPGTPGCSIHRPFADGRTQAVSDGLFWRNDGSSLPIDYVSAPIMERGQVTGVVVSFRNISQRKRMQDLNRSNAELEQFAYVASHDLQEPLRMITSYTNLLAKRYAPQLDDDAREFMNYTVDGAKRMQILINDLLAYSRVGTKGKEFAPVDLESALMRTLAILQIAISESNATISHDPLPVVSGDDVQIGQLLQNLVANAIKYRNDHSPKIHIACEQQQGHWRFSVRDNGIGIDPKFAERIFVIFQRLHTKENYPGTGIGLALCKKIVERHGGKIWVQSQLGQGATFFFTLPMETELEDVLKPAAGTRSNATIS